MSAEKDDRNHGICRMYAAGASMVHIARCFSISRTLVRTVLQNSHVTKREPAQSRRKPEYATWSGIKTRCHNPNYIEYHLYGGRGIVMCPEWKDSFEVFLKDVGPRPSPQHSIHRIDPDQGYHPSNCRWATRHEQSRAKRSTVLVTAFNETKCLQDWARDSRCNVVGNQIKLRIAGGMSPEQAITKPSQIKRYKTDTHKQCTQCGRIKLRTEFNIHRRDAPDPHKGKCKICQHSKTKETYTAQAKHKPTPYKGEHERECGRCGNIKPNDEFYPMTTRNGSIKPYARCIICCKEVNQEQKAKRAAKQTAP